MQICIDLKLYDVDTTLILITTGFNSSVGYIIGAILALFILGYLIYSLIKPENF